MDTINSFISAIKDSLDVAGVGSWVFQLFFVILLVVAANFSQKRALNKLAQKLEKTRNPWDDAFIIAIQKPLTLLFWIVGLSIAVEIVKGNSAEDMSLLSYFEPLREVGVVYCIAWFLVRLIQNVKVRYISYKEEDGEDIDRTTFDVLGNLSRIAVIITAALVVLQTLGFSISGVLAFGGVGGIAVGFAAKDLLANFFGSLIIFLDRPFRVGDWIRSPDRNIEGTVESIGWRTTCIRTFDKRPLYVPNSVFNSIAVENPSRMTNRRIKETIGLRYDDAAKVSDIVDAVKAMLRSHEEIDQNQTMIVNFDSFGPSSLDFFIYTFTKTTNWIKFHEIKHDVLLKIEKIITEHDAEIAFPTRTLHMFSEQSEAHAAN